MTHGIPFNAAPLVEPVDRGAAREFGRRTRAQGYGGGNLAHAFAIGAVIVTVVLFLYFGGMVGFGIHSMVLDFAPHAGAAALIAAGVPVLLLAGLTALVIVGFLRANGKADESWYRFDRFARSNGMTYLPSIDAPPLPGMIFTVGDSRSADDLVRGTQPRFVEFANYRYTTGSGKNRTTHRWGYVAVRLDVPLPNIVLDAASNNGLWGTTLPARFEKDRRLSLEGNFDQYFSLYCPEGYERDALYLFTPDIMARFIDHAAALDVEIVDDWLFLYGRRDFSTLDPATWAWLFSVVAALLDKFTQWARWRDDRLRMDAAAFALPAAAPAAASALPVGPPIAAPALPFTPPLEMLRPPPPGVAPPGRRLDRKTPVWVIVGSVAVGVAVVAIVLLPLLLPH